MCGVRDFLFRAISTDITSTDEIVERATSSKARTQTNHAPAFDLGSYSHSPGSVAARASQIAAFIPFASSPTWSSLQAKVEMSFIGLR